MRKRMTIEERIEKRRGKILGHFGTGLVWSPRVLRIDPEWARQIDCLGKTWEFRRAALPLDRVYLLETAPVNAITGFVLFDEAVGRPRCDILQLVKRLSNARIDSPGRNAKTFLEKYAKAHETVWAHHIVRVAMFEHPVMAGADDGRGLWLDVPANPIEGPSVSFQEKDGFFRLMDELSEGRHDFWRWHDPADASAKYAEIRAGFGWGGMDTKKGGAQ